MTDFPPFHILQPVKSLPFYTPKSLSGGASPYRRKEYPLASATSSPKFFKSFLKLLNFYKKLLKSRSLSKIKMTTIFAFFYKPSATAEVQ